MRTLVTQMGRLKSRLCSELALCVPTKGCVRETLRAIDIALTLADRYGPPSEADFEEQFSALRRNILELEEAAVARR
jgi:hypothetical protein